MCASAPKPPKVEKIPIRAAALLPDNGDPSARSAQRNRQRLTTSAMIFTNQGTLGSPAVSGPLGTTGA